MVVSTQHQPEAAAAARARAHEVYTRVKAEHDRGGWTGWSAAVEASREGHRHNMAQLRAWQQHQQETIARLRADGVIPGPQRRAASSGASGPGRRLAAVPDRAYDAAVRQAVASYGPGELLLVFEQARAAARYPSYTDASGNTRGVRLGADGRTPERF